MKATLKEIRKRGHWSYSSLNQLLNICSLQWYFQRVEKIEPARTSVNLVAGSCHHRTLDQVYLAIKAGKPLALDETLEVFSAQWRSASGEQVIAYGALDAQGVEEQGRGLVKVAFEHIDPAEKVLSVSEAFCVPLSHGGRFLAKPLAGEFDLVVERDGQPLVIDWKTSASRWPKGKADRSLQATTYSYAYRQAHGCNPQVRFDVAVKNKTPVFEQHPTQRAEGDWHLLGALADRAESIAKRGLFYPSLESFACGDCPFAQECKAWCAGTYVRKGEAHELAA